MVHTRLEPTSLPVCLLAVQPNNLFFFFFSTSSLYFSSSLFIYLLFFFLFLPIFYFLFFPFSHSHTHRWWPSIYIYYTYTHLPFVSLTLSSFLSFSLKNRDSPPTFRQRNKEKKQLATLRAKDGMTSHGTVWHGGPSAFSCTMVKGQKRAGAYHAQWRSHQEVSYTPGPISIIVYISYFDILLYTPILQHICIKISIHTFM